MTSSFVDNQKTPSGQEYLDASLPEILERANKSSNQSEIPFVSAVMAAKANRDQARSACRTLVTAITSALVAVGSLFFAIYVHSKDSSSLAVAQKQLSILEKENITLTTRLRENEKKHEYLAGQIDQLQKNFTKAENLFKSAIRTIPSHEHECPKVAPKEKSP